MVQQNSRDILKLELIGIVFIVLLGSAFHFTFDLSGGNIIIAFFSAVNESVWEHLKLAFWPSLFFALIELSYLKKISNNFFTAKAVGIYLMPLIIVSSFYSYTFLFKENVIIDILIFVMAVAIGQMASYRLMIWKPIPKTYIKPSVTAIILLAIVFIIFTYSPPRLPIFQDPISGTYGISG